MKIEDQVVSLELAKQLKQLGIKQDSLWYYAKFEDDSHLDVVGSIPFDLIWRIISRGSFEFEQFDEIYSAYTFAEISNMLPATLECDIESCDGIYIQTGKEKDGTWNCNDGNYYAKSKRIADAPTKMIIYLLSEDCHYDDKEFLEWKAKLLGN